MSHVKLKRKDNQLKKARRKGIEEIKEEWEPNKEIELELPSEDRRTCDGPVKSRYDGVGYILKEMSKANRPGQSFFSTIWRFFVFNSFIWPFSF
jgi:hypothetical protein